MKLRNLFLLLCAPLVRAQCDPNFQDMRPVPLGALSVTVKQKQGAGVLQVAEVTAGGPGALAGLIPGDFIYGVNGERLSAIGRPHVEGVRGALSEMGYAIERSESTTGALALQVLRPGTGSMHLSAALPVLPGLTRGDMAWRPSVPAGDARMAACYEKVCADIHVKIQAPDFFPTAPANLVAGDHSDYYGPFYGMILLAHPDWNATAGLRPYRNSINKLRDRTVAYLNTRVLAPVPKSNPGYKNAGLENWHLTANAMFLGEYRRKSGDSSVNAAVQLATDLITNRIQDNFDSDMGHGGVDQSDVYNGGDLNAMNANAMLAMGILKGAGADFTRTPGTSGRTINQKYLNNWDRLKRSTFIYSGTNEELKLQDGNVAYGVAPSGAVAGNGCAGDWDSNARTPCTAVGYEIYRAAGGTASTADDLLKLGRIKAFTPRNWPKQHNNHGYSTTGTMFSQMVLPFVTDREQRYFRENSRFLFTLGRDHTGAILWVPGRNNLTFGDIALGADNVRYLQPGMAWAVASGNLPSFPAAANAASRIFVRMNSPVNDWPQLDARRVRAEAMVQDLDLDVTNFQGSVLTSGYTAAWSQLSGVAVTFTTTNTLDTRVTFAACGDYRLRLTVTAGSYTVTEDYDFEILNPSPPPDLSATIVQQPVSRTGVPGGCADFSTLVSGGGPFIYEWKRNGVSVGVSGASAALNLTNLSAGMAGTYQCTVYHPGGQLITAPAVLTVSAALTVAPGGLKREVWYKGGGISVSALTGLATYPLCPDTTGVVSEAEGPRDVGVNYGQKLSGWVVPPVTGTYNFYLATDDEGELWLSTNATPAGKVKIATVTPFTGFRQYSTGASAGIALTAGQRYYIEALQVNGGGASDHLSIAWRKPGDAVPADGSAPIPGAYLEYEKVTIDPEFDGLVSRWSFDEASGTTVRDAMGTANDGTLTGPAWVTGRRGAGLRFDSNDKIVCSNAGSLGGLTPFTVAAWVKVDAGIVDMVILQQRSISGFDGQYMLVVRPTGKAGIFCYGNGAEQFNLSGAKSINDGLWHHVAAMRDAAGGARIYVDGLLDGSVTGTTVRSLNASIGIGIGADIRDNVRSFRGVIDDVRIYNRDLTASQVFALASTGEWSTAPWTGDASAGIQEDTKWAYHFGAGASTVIGNAIVTGVAGTNPSTGDFTITGVGNVLNGDTNNLTGLTGTGSATVAKDFIYGGSPATITLQGLIPGRRYVTTILSVGWEAAGGRQVTFSSGGDTMVVDQGQYGDNNGLRVTYAFVADAATRVITVAPLPSTPAFTFHLYALALWQQPFVVTNTSDAGGGSLRQALADAAASPGRDNITFDPATLNGQTITLTSELVVSDSAGVTVDAASLAGGVAVSGGQATRVFYNGINSNLTLRRLTLTGGNGAGAASSGYGGAVLNSSGTLTVDRCTLAGNSAAKGGALFSSTSSITGQITSTTLLTQCTLFDNTAVTNGGAVYNNNGQTTMLHCTVSCNNAPTGAGAGVSSFGDNLTRTAARYCIIAGNGASDVDFYSAASNSFLSQGSNLIGRGNATGSFVVAGDSINHTSATIKLSPPGSYGGPSWTMALLPGSPAREAAAASPDKFDQRGFPVVGLPDSGAYEAGTLTNYNAWIYETLPATASVTQHGAVHDYDGDGLSNYDECIFGTGPAASTSAFPLTAVRSGADLRITFPTATGRTYTLQQSDSLAAGSWANTPGAAAKTGNGTQQVFILPPPQPASPGRIFYRIAVTLTP